VERLLLSCAELRAIPIVIYQVSNNIYNEIKEKPAINPIITYILLLCIDKNVTGHGWLLRLGNARPNVI